MRVLGVSLGHDSNACLLEDGKIVRYIAEERFNRLKVGVNNAIESVHYCLGDYKLEDMDSIVVSTKVVGITRTFFRTLFKSKTTLGIPVTIRNRCFETDRVKEIDHHNCHAASAYYTSGLDNSLIVTIDGIGDDTTQFVALGQGAKIKPLAYVKQDGVYIRGQDNMFHVKRFKENKTMSWGWFYGMVTEAIGFRMVVDEGKTMGMAPYGDASKVPLAELKKPMYRTHPEGFYHEGGKVYYHFGGAEDYEKMAAKYGRENMAAAAQKLLEDKVITYIKKWLKRTGQRNLCTAGGVFLNVKLNQRIVEECDLDNYWPFPLASDCGLSIGAAMVEYYSKCDTYRPERLTNLYFGSEYSDDEIKKILDRNKLHYKPYDVNHVAQALADNKIVAWFQGRMEGGPRALGGRSILMSPLKAENKDTINSCVKFREGFRPFCPSVTSEAADRYFDGGNEFMIVSCNVKTKDIPAVTHVDNTARPQRLKREDNPKFHELLTKFGELTGHPVLLNTSFNIMGQPIIRTPEEAIRGFYGVGLDMLVIGNYMLEKQGRIQ